MKTWRQGRAGPVLIGVGCVLALTACASQTGQADGAAVGAGVTAPTASLPAPGSGSASATLAATSGQAASPHACTSSQIRTTLTDTGAIANQAGGYLEFTNDSGTTCDLTGWPAATGITQAGTSAPLKHATSTQFGAWRLTTPLPVVRLASGHSAYAVVAGSEIPVGSATKCPAPYTRLEVTIPGGTSAASISAWLPGANTDLPTCLSIRGGTTDETSDIVPLASLAPAGG